MRHTVRGKTILWTILAVSAFIGMNRSVHGSITAWITDGATTISVPLRQGFATVGSVLRNPWEVARENERLRDEIATLQSLAALQEHYDKDLAFYRTAANIRSRFPRTEIIEGSVFAIRDASGIREATVNRGSNEGVAEGDVVIDATGILMGMVAEVSMHHAVVRLVGDSGLEVAGRVLGTSVTGLVRGSSGQLSFDLIRKDDPIIEGQVVVTSGDDQLPPALVIGTIRSIDAQAPTLFAVVRIDPALEIATAAQVLVLHQ